MLKKTGWILVLLLCFVFPAASWADDSGVLSEAELSQWLDQVLMDSTLEEPLNAPVGEEACTEEGYAFLYEFATLYYDKPVLDEHSVLQAVSVTDERYFGPRGIRLGDGAEILLETFGWQNPTLTGDGFFAAFYLLDELPRAAYWSWAQHDEAGQLTAVQCAVHVQTGDGSYTDAGVRFLLTNGAVSAIHVYGLSEIISRESVQANLEAVLSVQNARTQTEGYTQKNDAQVFSQQDLTVGKLAYQSLDSTALNQLLGEEANVQTLQDNAVQMETAEWTQAYLSRTDGRTDVFSTTSAALEGPRGIRTGDSLESVLVRFYADGQGRTLDGIYAVLYGDGVQAPCGVMERSGMDTAVSYTVQADDGTCVTLRMSFENHILQEWMLYSW